MGSNWLSVCSFFKVFKAFSLQLSSMTLLILSSSLFDLGSFSLLVHEHISTKRVKNKKLVFLIVTVFS